MAKQTLLIGAHMSIAGGPYHAIISGNDIGCTAIQIFTKNNRQWKFDLYTDEEVENFKKAKNESRVEAINSHASYLINLGSPKKDVEKKAIKALKAELERCNQLEIPYTVLHPGSHLKQDEDACLQQIAQNLDLAIDAVGGNCDVLLEIMAGQGSSVGYSFKQLATIRNATKHKDSIGVCFDTCHAFAAGYTFSNIDDYEKMWNEIDNTIGINSIKLFHMNDSKGEAGSHLDRHESIGEGKIGLNAFRLLLNDKRFFGIPKVIETPKDKTPASDIQNLQTLISLIDTDELQIPEIPNK
jgi:deoxyribonuclease-4